jgi:hypothetical protein
MEMTVMDESFDPERYGMVYCPVCKGSGKLFDGVEEEAVCKACGGFGLVKKYEPGLSEEVESYPMSTKR